MKKLTLFLVIFVAFISSLNAKWNELKPLSSYGASDYNLKGGTVYLELRQYLTKEDGSLTKKPYEKTISFYRKDLKELDRKKVRMFKKLKPIDGLKSNIHISRRESYGVGCYYTYNAFLIDNKYKMYKMNNVEDVIGYLGDIDTPAELQTLMLLKNKPYGSKYRKTSKGYEVLYNRGTILGEDEFCEDNLYVLSVNKSGKIIEDKFLKTIKTKRRCIQCVMPAPCSSSI